MSVLERKKSFLFFCCFFFGSPEAKTDLGEKRENKTHDAFLPFAESEHVGFTLHGSVIHSTNTRCAPGPAHRRPHVCPRKMSRQELSKSRRAGPDPGKAKLGETTRGLLPRGFPPPRLPPTLLQETRVVPPHPPGHPRLGPAPHLSRAGRVERKAGIPHSGSPLPAGLWRDGFGGVLRRGGHPAPRDPGERDRAHGPRALARGRPWS